MRQFTDPIFSGLLDAAPVAMVCVDSDGRIVLVNAQAERLFGYPREELAGQPVEILVPGATKAGHAALRARYAANPRPRQMDSRLDLSGRRRDGTTFPAEIALSAIDTSDGILDIRRHPGHHRPAARPCPVPGAAGGGAGRDGVCGRGRADRAGERPGGAAVRVPP